MIDAKVILLQGLLLLKRAGSCAWKILRFFTWARIRAAINVVFLLGVLASIAPVLMLAHADQEAVSGKIVLKFMYWGGPEQLLQENDVRAAYLAQLKREGRTDIQLELLAANARYDTKLKAMMSAGETPDVFMVASGLIARFADRENPLIADITDLVVEDRKAEAGVPASQRQLDFDDLLPQAVRTFYCNGRLYGFPRDYKCSGVAYNADMLAAAGLEDPNDLYARNEWTWEKFAEYLRKLKRPVMKDGKEDEQETVYGLCQDNYSEGYWANIMLQAGGGVWSDDGRELIADRPESIRGLQFVHELAWTKKLARPYSPELGAANAWVAQKTAFLTLRGWHVPSYIKQTYVPKGPLEEDPENAPAPERDEKGEIIGWRLKNGAFVPSNSIEWLSPEKTPGKVPFRASNYLQFAWDVAPWPLGLELNDTPEPVKNAKGELAGWRLASGRVVYPDSVYWASGTPGKPPFRLRQCTATSVGYVMAPNPKHPKEAWRLLKFLVGPEAQRIRAGFDLPIGNDKVAVIAGPNMPSRQSLTRAYLDMGRNCPVRPRFTGCLARKNQQELWPRIDVFMSSRLTGRPSTGAISQDEVGRYLDRQVQRLFLTGVAPEELVREARSRADDIYPRIREGFPSSFNTPSMARPAKDDPLGLAQ